MARLSLVILSLGLLVGGCAPYQIGASALYPAHIQTIYVPVFRSSSLRRDLGERLTEAVVKEIELKTPFKVVSTPDADSTLIGEVVGDEKHMIVSNPNGDPRQIEIGLHVRITWTDQTGGPVRNGMQVPLESTPLQVDTMGKAAPELGHSVVTAQQQAIHRAAVQIVSMMETPW